MTKPRSGPNGALSYMRLFETRQMVCAGGFLAVVFLRGSCLARVEQLSHKKNTVVEFA